MVDYGELVSQAETKWEIATARTTSHGSIQGVPFAFSFENVDSRSFRQTLLYGTYMIHRKIIYAGYRVIPNIVTKHQLQHPFMIFHSEQ